jgi:hypothetical protein
VQGGVTQAYLRVAVVCEVFKCLMIEFLPCKERSFLKRSIRVSQLALSSRGWGPYVRMMPTLRYRSSAMRRASVSLTNSVWRTCSTAFLTSPSQTGLMEIDVEVG